MRNLVWLLSTSQSGAGQGWFTPGIPVARSERSALVQRRPLCAIEKCSACHLMKNRRTGNVTGEVFLFFECLDDKKWGALQGPGLSYSVVIARSNAGETKYKNSKREEASVK